MLSARWVACWLALACFVSLSNRMLHAEEPAPAALADDPAAPPPVPANIETLAEAIRPSLAIVTYIGRDGRPEGLGTGFVISADGLVATNYHVIGEARPIRVEIGNKTYDVTAVEASDRLLDLAVLRIDAKELAPLSLGDSSALKPGQPVAAFGNPRGLTHSVVTGVVSARREVDGKPMIQLAIPIEQGNSGGPLVDLAGKVYGIVNMKSLVTPNLGFAIEINSLKPLLEKPNPIRIDRWLTIGALDAAEWQPLFGAKWWQRAGRVMVSGWGKSFGGRSLLLWQPDLPALPYEFAATVKLDDESGAAGLAFHSDGGDRHYGFYPSDGQLRLTRFDGPDVLSWVVLKEVRSEYYRPGDWNRLHVRIEKDRILCSVNGHVVIESDDNDLRKGRIGLAKFRATAAEFKQFAVGAKLATDEPSAELAAEITRLVGTLSTASIADPAVLDPLAAAEESSVIALQARARELKRQAELLEDLADAVHRRRAVQALEAALEPAESQIDLIHAALLIAWMDNDELDVAAYRRQFDRLAADLAKSLPEKADDAAKLKRLGAFLFDELGFHGSRGDYYNRANSYINEVLDDREGIPITLSVIYIELGRRIGLSLAGVGLPGHFVVKYSPDVGEPQYIDVFERGNLLDRAGVAELVEENSDVPLRDEHLAVVTKRAIVVRMLHNLLGIRQRSRDAEGMVPYLDALVALSPEGPERWIRAIVHYQSNRFAAALRDVEWILEHKPRDVELSAARELESLLRAALEKQE